VRRVGTGEEEMKEGGREGGRGGGSVTTADFFQTSGTRR